MNNANAPVPLKVDGLVKTYGAFALQGVSLEVPAGAVVGLVGSNGAGKTTTIKAPLGLVRPDAGAIELFGRRLGEDPALDAALRQRVGVVFDACSFPKGMRVRDVAVAMRAAYRAWDDAAFEGHLSGFGLTPALKVGELSRGMGMKLMLACALSHEADLLVLDEATAGLDPLAREEVLGIVRDYLQVEGRSVLMATHITSDLESIADYVVCIDGGRVAFALEKDQITDVAGIVRCRKDQLDDLLASGAFEWGTLCWSNGAYGASVLVEDRRAFARRFGDMVVERPTIEEYMALVLKGERA